MAAAAAGAEFLRADACRMTTIASQLFVRASQYEFCIAGVIEAGWLPITTGMAFAAVITHASGVCVLSTMTTMAIFWHRVFHPTTGMAAGAVSLRMGTEQCKTGFLGMIELGRSPASSRMTLTTPAGTRATMHVIRRMARCALFGRVLVTILQVTRSAGHFSMFVGQRELGLAVIKLGIEPGSHAMTGSAVVAQLPLMWLVFFVA